MPKTKKLIIKRRDRNYIYDSNNELTYDNIYKNINNINKSTINYKLIANLPKLNLDKIVNKTFKK